MDHLTKSDAYAQVSEAMWTLQHQRMEHDSNKDFSIVETKNIDALDMALAQYEFACNWSHLAIPPEFAEIEQFAKKSGSDLSLLKRLNYLATWGGEGLVCHIYYAGKNDYFEFNIVDAENRTKLFGGCCFDSTAKRWDTHT